MQESPSRTAAKESPSGVILSSHPELHVQVNPVTPATLLQVAFGSQLCVPKAHSSIKSHVRPSPVYPETHLQSNLSGGSRFKQSALASQSFNDGSAHSSKLLSLHCCITDI